jgi:hypothetical protein
MNIQKYLPSRNIQIIVISLLVIGIAYLVYFFVTKNKKPAEQDLISVALVDESEKSEYYRDTDNDGAYDWEEALWPELDPNNPDSDGDGILDGKYIKTKQAIQEKERRGVTNLQESNLTETEKLGRSAYTALLAIAQSGGELDEATEEQFSQNIADYVSNLTLGDKVYLREELRLVEDSQENIYAYRDRMKGLLADYPVATSDIELLLSAAEDPANYENDLRTASLKYGDYLFELIDTDTPYVIAGRHTELINNISQISAAVDNLLEEEQDELVSLAFLVQVQDILNQTTEAIVKINTFFEIIKDESLLTS